MNRRHLLSLAQTGVLVQTGVVVDGRPVGPALWPRTVAERAANVMPANFYYPVEPFIDVRRYGALGNGTDDDGPAINTALVVAGKVAHGATGGSAYGGGTGALKIVILPKPAISYLINTSIVSQPGVSLLFNPEDISVSGTQYRTLPLMQLLSPWGLAETFYKTTLNSVVTVDPNNGAYRNPSRYWPIIGGVIVPHNATVMAGDVREDHVGVSGIALSNALNSRIWGGAFIAQVNQAATTDEQIGFAAGCECDINNDSGRAYGTYDRNVVTTALQLGVGGTGNSGSLLNMQGNGGSGGQVVAGWTIRGGCLSVYGIYVDNEAPSQGFLYISDAYAGGAILNVKNGAIAVYMRNATDTGHCGRIISTSREEMVINSASGKGTGTFGFSVSNHANTQTNLGITDAGTVQHQRSAETITTVRSTGTLTGQPVASSIINFTRATQINNLAAGEIAGQRVTIYNTNSDTLTLVHSNFLGGSPLVLSAASDALLTQYSNLTLFFDGTSWIECARMIAGSAP